MKITAIRNISAVLLGADTVNGHHFMAIKLVRPPEEKVIKEICDALRDYFVKNGPFIQREFVGNEMHFYPSARSEEFFKTSVMAIKEYQRVLEVLGLGEWSNEMVMDGTLLPFAERTNKLQAQPKGRLQCPKH